MADVSVIPDQPNISVYQALHSQFTNVAGILTGWSSDHSDHFKQILMNKIGPSFRSFLVNNKDAIIAALINLLSGKVSDAKQSLLDAYWGLDEVKRDKLNREVIETVVKQFGLEDTIKAKLSSVTSDAFAKQIIARVKETLLTLASDYVETLARSQQVSVPQEFASVLPQGAS